MLCISLAILIASILLTWGISTILFNIINKFVPNYYVEMVEFMTSRISLVIFGLILIPSLIISFAKEKSKLREECIKYGKKIDFRLEDVFYYDTTQQNSDDTRNIFCIIKDLNTNDLYCVSNVDLNIIWAELKGDKQITANINGKSKQINIGDTLTGWILTETVKEEKISTKGLTYYKESKKKFWGEYNILFNFNSNNDISILNQSYKICDGWYEFN